LRLALLQDPRHPQGRLRHARKILDSPEPRLDDLVSWFL